MAVNVPRDLFVIVLVAVFIVLFTRDILWGQRFRREPAWARWVYLAFVVALLVTCAVIWTARPA
jgi:hypothetical protein